MKSFLGKCLARRQIAVASQARVVWTIAAAMVFVLVVAADAETTIDLTTASGNGRDDDVIENLPDSNSGTARTFLELRSRNVTGSTRHRVPFLCFDLSAAGDQEISAATLSWFHEGTLSGTIDVFGVVDGISGEASWTEAGLTYNTAPGFSTANYPNPDRNHAPGELTFLGSVSVSGSGSVSLSNAALQTFLNADTNGLVTFVLEPEEAASGADFFNNISSAEHSIANQRPGLSITVPEEPVDGPVSFVDLGNEVVLENGEVSVRIRKDSAMVVSLKKGNQEYLGVSNAQGYFQRVADGRYTTPSGMTFSLVRQTPSLVEVKFRRFDLADYPFVFETHYVLRSGESGFYNFTVLEYPPGSTHPAELEQLTLLFRVNPSLFRVAQIRDDLWQVMPTIQEYNAGVQVMDATFRLDENSSYALREGDPVYTKYNKAASFEDLDVYGTCGEGGYGFWQVTPSHEYVNGAPTTTELTVHQTSSTVACMRMLTGGHFGSGKSVFDTLDGGWRKVYGPWFIYLNEGATREAMWADAKEVAATHKEMWPYDWMQHSEFPLDRHSVEGSLQLTTGEPAADALVFLAQPEGPRMPNYQQQAKNYVFWTHSAPDGSFTIPHVRKGSYSLYALVDGVPELFELPGVDVTDPPGPVVDLGEVYWSPLRYGTTVWQVGIPDRDSTEFRGGDDYRHWGLEWEPYTTAFPDGVNYVVGQSDWSTDWYFVQNATKIDDVTYAPTTWTVSFQLDEIPTGQWFLRFGLAGSRSALLRFYLNDNPARILDENFDLGSGCPRSGSRGYHQEVLVPFASDMLRIGDNTLTLVQARGRIYSNVHWDYLRLVAPEEPAALRAVASFEQNGRFRLTWPSTPTMQYQWFTSKNLIDWQPLDSEPWMGTGSPGVRIVPVLENEPRRFFRVEAQPMSP